MKTLTTTELSTLENELGVELPQHYKDFHLNHVDLIKELRESDSVPEDDGMWLSTDIENIVEYNRFSGLPKSEGPTRNKFYIGGDGCGGSCFIDLKNPENTEVYFISPDDFEELFVEEDDDFNWDSDLAKAGKDLEEFVRNRIRFNRED